MGIESKNKRMSMIGLAHPVPTVLPDPDGTVDTQDRAMFLWLYHGIALAGAVKRAGFRLFRFVGRRRLNVVFIDKESPVTFEPKDTSFEDKPAPVFKEK